MPTEPLPLLNALQSGDEELAGASPQALNVTVDRAGAVRRRPGIANYFTAPELAGAPALAARAIHATEDGIVFAVVPHGPTSAYALDVYRMTPGGAALVGTMLGDARPVMIETEMLLLIAAGQRPAKVELASPGAVSLLGGDPPQCTHLIHNSLRLLGNDRVIDRTKVRYSDQAAGTTTYAGHEMWTVGVGTAGFFTAEAAPDPVVAVAENTNEVWAYGSRTLQLFVADPSLVFAPAVTMEVGCGAPYSVVKREGEFYWLDHARRFVRSSGRGTEVLSQGLQRTIQRLGTVRDCVGYRVLDGPVDGVAWRFPSEGRTFFWQDGGGWSEWTSWSSATNQHLPFVVDAAHYDAATGINLVGVPGWGVAKLQGRRATDISLESGGEPEPIVAEVTTGFLNRGTDSRKWCKSLRLTFRRGEGATRNPEVRGYITYRDSLGPWEAPIPVVLDGIQPVCELNGLGTYRRRQWKYTFSDEVEELVLAGAEEEFVVTD